MNCDNLQVLQTRGFKFTHKAHPASFLLNTIWTYPFFLPFQWSPSSMHHFFPGLRPWPPTWMSFLPTLLFTLHSAASYLSITQIQFVASAYNLLELPTECKINAWRHKRANLSGLSRPLCLLFHNCTSPPTCSLLPRLTSYFHAWLPVIPTKANLPGQLLFLFYV